MTYPIFLARHAEVDDSPVTRYVGSTDLPLTRKGIRQAEQLNVELQKRQPEKCLCSPLRRALQTAEIAVASLNMPIETKSDLREIDFGRWEMRTFQQIQQENPGEVEKWAREPNDFCFPEGECIRHFYERIGKVAEGISEYNDSKTVIVAHGGVIQTLICHLIGLPPSHRLAFRIDLASLSTIEMIHGTGRLTELNYTDHLIDNPEADRNPV